MSESNLEPGNLWSTSVAGATTVVLITQVGGPDVSAYIVWEDGRPSEARYQMDRRQFVQHWRPFATPKTGEFWAPPGCRPVKIRSGILRDDPARGAWGWPLADGGFLGVDPLLHGCRRVNEDGTPWVEPEPSRPSVAGAVSTSSAAPPYRQGRLVGGPAESDAMSNDDDGGWTPSRPEIPIGAAVGDVWTRSGDPPATVAGPETVKWTSYVTGRQLTSTDSCWSPARLRSSGWTPSRPSAAPQPAPAPQVGEWWTFGDVGPCRILRAESDCFKVEDVHGTVGYFYTDVTDRSLWKRVEAPSVVMHPPATPQPDAALLKRASTPGTWWCWRKDTQHRPRVLRRAPNDAARFVLVDVSVAEWAPRDGETRRRQREQMEAVTPADIIVKWVPVEPPDPKHGIGFLDLPVMPMRTRPPAVIVCDGEEDEGPWGWGK